MTFTFPDQFQDLTPSDSGSYSDRIVLLGKRKLLDGLAKAKLWLTDGTFKVVIPLYFHLYTIHFKFVPGIHFAKTKHELIVKGANLTTTEQC